MNISFEFWLNAFIQKEMNWCTKPLPGDPSRTMLDVPTLPYCFLTDQRIFSSSSDASSRVQARAILSFDGSNFTFTEANRCFPTHRVDCSTGVLAETGTATADRIKFSNPRINGNRLRINLSGAANNPLVSPSPDIDFNGLLTINLQDYTASFVGYVEPFPSFEAYVRIAGGNPIELFRREPDHGANPWDLAGAPTIGITTGPKNLLPPLSGKWRDGSRWELEFSSQTQAIWREYRGGKSLSKTVPVEALPSQGWNVFRINRTNDRDVLGFHGCTVINEVLAKNPEPSFMQLTVTPDSISSRWHGLSWALHPNGSLKSIKQPSQQPGRTYNLNQSS